MCPATTVAGTVINKLPQLITKKDLTVACIQLAAEEDIVIAKMDATANDVPKIYNVRGYVSFINHDFSVFVVL